MLWRSLMVLLATATLAHAAPAGLDAPAQADRDAAAAEIRPRYKPPPRTRWEPLLAAIKPGDSKKLVLARLTPAQAKPGVRIAAGRTYSEAHQLDDRWQLICWFEEATDKVLGATLAEQMLNVWVAPPAHFTGTWTVYYVNGQRDHEIVFEDGKTRVVTAFYDDGSLCFVQRYNDKGIYGEEIGYYRSGKINYRGMHKDGESIGLWTWYNEDGTVKSTKQYDPPKPPSPP